MSLKELIEEKLSRLESVPDALISSTQLAQRKLLKELLKSLNGLETDSLGNILFSKKNLAQIEQILNKLREALFGTEYTDAITLFAKELSKQAALNNTYFGKVFDKEAPEALTELIKTSQKQALRLLDSDAVSSVLLEPLRTQLSHSISTGASITDTVSLLTNFIEGNGEIDGLLLRHVKRVSYDAFAVSDRQYTDVFSQALDVQWYLYQGGVLSDSREFCLERHGKYYHKKEIEAWASLEWQGKNSATTEKTIFLYCGGYNCKHALLPVSEEVVPKSDKDRAKSKGFI